MTLKCLCRKYQAACDGMNLTKDPFVELTESLDHDKVNGWQEAANNAAVKRGDALDIYTLKMEQGLLLFDFSIAVRLTPSFL